MKMSQFGVASALRQLLPHFVTAGRVACTIQDAIVSGRARPIEQKGGSRFSAALTDADILVEGFLGMFLLSSYEDVAFYGEEYASDRISAYFPKSAEYMVTLDPIDGTRYFMDGQSLFGIIMTVCREGRMIASVVYLPRDERFFVAVQGSGAFTMTAREAVEGSVWSRYRLEERGNIVLVSDQDLVKKPALEQSGFTVINNSVDYHGQPGWRNGSLRMLTGEVAGMVCRNAQLIDAGAVAFIVAMAGGGWNDPTYDTTSLLAPRIVCAASPQTYEKFAASLGEN